MQICSACSLESIIFTDFYIQIHLTWQKTCKLNLISFSHLTLFLFLGLEKMPETEKYCAWFWNISPLDWKQFNVETKAKQCLEKKIPRTIWLSFLEVGCLGLTSRFSGFIPGILFRCHSIWDLEDLVLC